MNMARIAALLAAGGIGEPFFCHLRLEESEASAEEQTARVLTLMERALGPVSGLALHRSPAAAGTMHWLVQARHAGGVAQLQMRFGTAATALEMVLEGRDGTLCLDRDGSIRRHGRRAAEMIAAPDAHLAEAAACQRVLALLRTTMTEPNAAA